MRYILESHSRRSLRGKPEGAVARREDYTVTPCEHRVARALVEQYHYTGSASNTSVAAHCLVRKADGKIVGSALWMPPTARAAQGLAREHLGSADRHREVLALSRLVIAPGEPQNAAGMLLGGSEKILRGLPRWALLVTYADTAEGHKGTIYKATNWVAAGLTEPRPRWREPSSGRLIAQKAFVNRTNAKMVEAGYIREPDSAKLRFIKRIKP
jgi:hypothetical protein